MYEIFTGKRPYEATTFEEMARLREKSTPTAPSAHLKDIDPLVERVMLRCLEKNPANRPASALQVAAALPGGDPLAAALAAGETPSPEMVAAAGTKGSLAPWLATSILIAVITLLIGNVFLSEHSQLPNLLPPGKSPEILQEASKNILQKIGYDQQPADSAYWLGVDDGYWSYSSLKPAPDRYRTVNADFPSPSRFFYRRAFQPLQTNFPYWVFQDNPAFGLSGDTIVGLDDRGRLTSLRIAPTLTSGQSSEANNPSDLSSSTAAPNADAPAWVPLFEAAGLDLHNFKEDPADWQAHDPMDQQFAWQDAALGHQIRVQAGTLRGKPVYFRVLAPWNKDSTADYNAGLGAYELSGVLELTFAASLFCLTAFFAYRNIRMERSDLAGAFRGAALLFVAIAIFTILNTHWAGDLSWGWNWWQLAVSRSAGLALQYAALYLGLEPYLRRTWPELLISWSRLLAGGFRNPLVGRDILMGALFGAAAAFLVQLQTALPYWFAIRSVTPVFNYSHGLTYYVGDLIAGIIDPTLNAFGSLTVLFIALKIFRSKGISVLIVGIIWVLFSLQTENPWALLPLSILIAVLMLTCTLRNGVLGLIVALYMRDFIRSHPFTSDFSRWYAPYGVTTLLIALAIALVGFFVAVGGRRIFAEVLQD